VNVSSGEDHEQGSHRKGIGEEEEDVQIGNGTVWSETVTVQW